MLPTTIHTATTAAEPGDYVRLSFDLTASNPGRLVSHDWTREDGVQMWTVVFEQGGRQTGVAATTLVPICPWPVVIADAITLYCHFDASREVRVGEQRDRYCLDHATWAGYDAVSLGVDAETWPLDEDHPFEATSTDLGVDDYVDPSSTPAGIAPDGLGAPDADQPLGDEPIPRPFNI